MVCKNATVEPIQRLLRLSPFVSLMCYVIMDREIFTIVQMIISTHSLLIFCFAFLLSGVESSSLYIVN